MCTVEVPTCHPPCLAEVLRKAMRLRNLLNRRNGSNIDPGPRRVLFDTPIDHAATAQFLARETERMRRDISARWNFDFETETPLTGRYQWTPVENQMPGESAYVITETTTTSSVIQPTTTTSPPDEPVPELIPAQSSSAIAEESKPEPESEAEKSLRQRKLTDYMPQRKRSSTSISKSSTEKPPESKIRRTDTSTSKTSA